MKVVWSDSATEHLVGIYQYIARDSERYALRMIDRITARSKQIGFAPELGQIVAEYGHPQVREVIEGPYRIIYRVESGRVAVLGVIHAARLLPALSSLG